MSHVMVTVVHFLKVVEYRLWSPHKREKRDSVNKLVNGMRENVLSYCIFNPVLPDDIFLWGLHGILLPGIL